MLLFLGYDEVTFYIVKERFKGLITWRISAQAEIKRAEILLRLHDEFQSKLTAPAAILFH